MRRADRLFQLVQLVRGRRLSTADFIAQRLEVSARTVYRDIADLQAQGVPIEGEAGVGYRMRAGFDLPPLMFTQHEAQALVAAVRARLEALRLAAEARHKLHIGYLDLKEVASQRSVRPLGCFFWGEVWTLAAWCETRAGFRSFRVDRITALEVLPERFRDEPGKTVADLLRHHGFDREQATGGP